MKKQEIRRGFEWYRKLTKKQQKNFKANCKDLNTAFNESVTFFQFTARSFDWLESYEGIKYWIRISDKKF